MASAQRDEDEGNDGLTVRWRREQARARWSRIIRWSIGITLILLCPWASFCAPALGGLGALLISPDIVSLLSGWAEHIWWSHGKSKPEPTYGIARTLSRRGKYAEAEAEYERIIADFPNDVQAHVDMIEIAVVRLNDGELAEKLFQRGMTLLKHSADRDRLSEAYGRIRTLLKKEEDMKPKTVARSKLDDVRAHWEETRRKLWR